ncbi:hypothetical protein ABPG73_011085 [Tetrahymena malaccensis]
MLFLFQLLQFHQQLNNLNLLYFLQYLDYHKNQIKQQQIQQILKIKLIGVFIKYVLKYTYQDLIYQNKQILKYHHKNMQKIDLNHLYVKIIQDDIIKLMLFLQNVTSFQINHLYKVYFEIIHLNIYLKLLHKIIEILMQIMIMLNIDQRTCQNFHLNLKFHFISIITYNHMLILILMLYTPIQHHLIKYRQIIQGLIQKQLLVESVEQ